MLFYPKINLIVTQIITQTPLKNTSYFIYKPKHTSTTKIHLKITYHQIIFVCANKNHIYCNGIELNVASLAKPFCTQNLFRYS